MSSDHSTPPTEETFVPTNSWQDGLLSLLAIAAGVALVGWMYHWYLFRG